MSHFRRMLFVLLFSMFFGLSFAQTPSFNFLPVSGTQVKLHCSSTAQVQIVSNASSSGEYYNGFNSAVSFDQSNIDVTSWSINSIFSLQPGSGLSAGLLSAFGNTPSGTYRSGNSIALDFSFKTKNNITGTEFKFTTKTGANIVFNQNTTDGADVYGYNWEGADILASANNTTYTFIPLPCTKDTNSPILEGLAPINNVRYLSGVVSGTFLILDWLGSAYGHYWYGGSSTILSNYVPVPVAGARVDNQNGINSGTIQVTVACPTCSSFGGPYTLSGSSLNITDWNGDASRNQRTWNSQRRGYNVSFSLPNSYEVEKPLQVTIAARDNPNEDSNTYLYSQSYSYNSLSLPTITRLLPSTNTFVSPSKTNVIRLFVSDDWAGVDTGTLKITIPRIMSGAEQLLTGYTYSGSELTFVLSGGSNGLGNSGKYLVDFNSNWDFPPNTGVTITGTVSDLAGNSNTFTTSFTTRPDCSFFGCHEILSINIVEGTNLGTYTFTGSTLIVTGTNLNSPYPYLTGTNSDILVCGFAWTGAVLTGNVQIYNGSSTLINGTVYSGNALYITGLNFTLVDGVIVVQ